LGTVKSGDPVLNLAGKKVSFSLDTSSPSANSSQFSTFEKKDPDVSTVVDLDEVKIPDEEVDHEAKDGEEKPVSSSSMRSLLRKSSIIDVIPEEAESLTVLVGGVKFLERPLTAFVRLEQVRALYN